MTLAEEAMNEGVGPAVKSRLLMKPDGLLRESRLLKSRASD